MDLFQYIIATLLKYVKCKETIFKKMNDIFFVSELG